MKIAFVHHSFQLGIRTQRIGWGDERASIKPAYFFCLLDTTTCSMPLSF
jgi:hypothetical protein